MNKSVKKIVVLGPESTGKSSLCQQLAEHYKTSWCKEYAREYLLANGTDYTYEDLLNVAEGQLALEDECTSKSTGTMVFIDTNMYVMKVWCEFVFEKCHSLILDAIVSRSYDHYFLCNIDLPWVADELREYPDHETRNTLYYIYKDLMINQSVPWTEISGNYEERFARAVRVTDQLIGKDVR